MIKLSAELVVTFVQLRERLKKLTKREKDDCAAIKEAFGVAEIEEYGPATSPYKLVMASAPKTEVDYKDMATKIYRKHYGKEWKEQFDADREDYGSKNVISLTVHVNERYRP